MPAGHRQSLGTTIGCAAEHQDFRRAFTLAPKVSKLPVAASSRMNSEE